jgi:type I restriction enzyme M protein
MKALPMNLSSNISEKAALIWAIADKLTGVYKPHEYGEVILPMTVIRRFDSIISDTKAAVLDKFKNVKVLPMRDVLLRKASGHAFYNTSKYDFEKLLDDPEILDAMTRYGDIDRPSTLALELLKISKNKGIWRLMALLAKMII